MRSSTSPFRGTTYSTQPESLEALIKSLERQNNGLVEQVNILKNKGKKVAELQDKIQLVLKHNTQLLNENQRLAKLINQKKTQIDTWKNKYDTLITSKNLSNDTEVKRLLNQIEKLKEDIVEMEHLKNLQINEIKNQTHLEIQNYKRGTLGNVEKYQLEIRKLKQFSDKKQFQISQLNMRIVRLNKETDFEIGKLKQQKERLKSDLMYEENQHKREVESLKSKFDYNFHSQIQNLKKQHLNQIEALDYQNRKLKQVINSKNTQIENIWIKNNKVKSNYQNSIQMIHRENQQLKDRIAELQHTSQLQLARLRDKLQGIKQSQVTMLKGAYMNQTDLLTLQINKLQQIINTRNSQLQNLTKQRNQIRTNLQNEVCIVKSELQAELIQNKNLIQRYEQKLVNCNYDLKLKNSELTNMQSLLKDQIQTLIIEKQSLENQLENLKNKLQTERNQKLLNQKSLNFQISNIKQSLASANYDIQKQKHSSNQDIEQLKKISQSKITLLQKIIADLQNTIQNQQKLVKQLKNIIQNKDREIKACEQRIQIVESVESQLRKQLRQATGRWDIRQKQLNNLLREQIKMMQNTRKKQTQQLKNIHQNKQNSKKHKINELEREIQTKNRLLNDLKQQYQQLVNKFEQVFSQRAAQKNLDIKVPGWLPETLATKSLFDVFLKNKVLEYCS